MPVPRSFPLYPNSSLMKFNVSLALPGPNLYDMPRIGPFAKKNGYPNTKYAALMPGTDYIQKFATYNIGISESMLGSSRMENMAKMKDENVSSQFTKVFDSGNQEGGGLKSLEKTILSSIFETQKPFFKIVQYTSQTTSGVEDVIARIAPLFGAAANPLLALAVKSRKPIGNGPAIPGNPSGVSVFGTPPALGYKGGEAMNSTLRKLKSITSKGKTPDIDRDGKFKGFENYTRGPVKEGPNINPSDYSFTYVTISTIYSTGTFDPRAEYLYRYIDIEDNKFDEEDIDILPDIDPTENELPERIILGIYDADGNPMDPFSKIQYLDVDQSNQLTSVDSIFPKASWITQSDKWVLGKSIDFPGTYQWDTLTAEIFYWKHPFQPEIIKQSESPGDDWFRLKYGDVTNFDSEENRIYRFKKDEFIVEFGNPTIERYKNYYEFITNRTLDERNIDPVDRPEIISDIRKIYDGNKILEQLQSLSKFGKLQSTLYVGVEDGDWKKYNPIVPPPSDTFEGSMRRIFKPMKFNIGGKDIWIDPETDYDYKVIRIDSSNKISYKSTSPSATNKTVGTFSKTSEIIQFIKNKLEINISDEGELRTFSIEVYKNGQIFETFTKITQYRLDNWDFEFDNSTNEFNKKNSNTFRFKIYLDRDDPPIVFRDSNVTMKLPNPAYPELVSDLPWYVQNSHEDSTESTFRVVQEGGVFSFKKVIYKYFTDTLLNPTTMQPEIHKRFSEEIFTDTFNPNGISPNQSGELIDQDQIRPYQVETINGIIEKWVIYDQTITVDSEFKFTSPTTFLPRFFKRNLITFNLQSDVLDSLGSGNLDTIESEDIPKYQVKLSIRDKFGNIVIDPSQKLNSELETRELLSSGRYGVGYTGGPVLNENGGPVLDDDGNPIIEPDMPMFVGYRKRSQLTELDTDTYFIIEAIKRKSNPANSDIGESGGGGGGGYYRLPDALGITPVMIRSSLNILTKLVPEIKKFISLIKNPVSFVTEIIKTNAEDHFTIFRPDVMSTLSEMKSMSNSAKGLEGEDLSNAVKEMRERSSQTDLSNYISVNDDASYKFILDGSALISFFGILFGFKVDLTNVGSIYPTFAQNQSDNNLTYFINKAGGNRPDSAERDENSSVTYNPKDIDKDTSGKRERPTNKIESQRDGNFYYEEISVQYSTGDFIEGVDYKYIYITQEISKLLIEADNLSSRDYSADLSNPNNEAALSSIQDAVSKYEAAYEMASQSGLDSEAFKSEVLKKIKNLKSKINILSQPTFKLFLGIVTLPLKIILEVIKWMLDFFKSLTNPIDIPPKIAEFLSFDWILQFFTPKGILEMAGIKFNPEKAAIWCGMANAKKSNSEYLLPDDYPLADLSQFLSVGFEATLPLYSAAQYRDVCLKPFRLMNPFLCLIEKIINGFIMLVWNLLGIGAIIPPPLIKLCNKTNEEVDPKDFNDIFNGLFKDSEANQMAAVGADPSDLSSSGGSGGGNGLSYSFIYEVKMPDGSIKRILDYEALQTFISENKDLDFEFRNFQS